MDVRIQKVTKRLEKSQYLVNFLKYHLENKLLSAKQHGFIAVRSTVTQLLKYLDKCAQAVANGKVVDAIYLDFEKAFNDPKAFKLFMKSLQSVKTMGERTSSNRRRKSERKRSSSGYSRRQGRRYSSKYSSSRRYKSLRFTNSRNSRRDDRSRDRASSNRSGSRYSRSARSSNRRF